MILKNQKNMMNFRHVASLLFIIISLSSCGEIYDLNGFDWQPDVPPSDSVFSREILILNLGDNLPEGHTPVDASDPLYFSLEKFSTVHLAYKTTDRWDLAFRGNSRSELSGNNGRATGLGYGSSAIGGMFVTDSPYDKITSIPDDSKFQAPGISGLDEIGEFGAPMGHVAYTFFGNMFRPDKVVGYLDNTYDPAVQLEASKYAHMLYALSDDFAKKYPVTINGDFTKCRTILLRTAAGNYAKVEILSYYRNTLDPREMNRGKGYAVSFRYMVVKADEKRFGFTPRRKAMTVNQTTKRVEIKP